MFSKYNINPLKNINFGPMQYGETRKMQIILKNEGIFDFNFAICDFKNTEAKRAIKEEEQNLINQRKEEALAAVNEDPKAKKAPPKEPAKKPPPKGGPDPDELRVS